MHKHPIDISDDVSDAALGRYFEDEIAYIRHLRVKVAEIAQSVKDLEAQLFTAQPYEVGDIKEKLEEAKFWLEAHTTTLRNSRVAD